MTHQMANRLTFGLGVLSVLAVILANLALLIRLYSCISSRLLAPGRLPTLDGDVRREN